MGANAVCANAMSAKSVSAKVVSAKGMSAKVVSANHVSANSVIANIVGANVLNANIMGAKVVGAIAVSAKAVSANCCDESACTMAPYWCTVYSTVCLYCSDKSMFNYYTQYQYAQNIPAYIGKSSFFASLQVFRPTLWHPVAVCTNRLINVSIVSQLIRQIPSQHCIARCDHNKCVWGGVFVCML